MDVLAQAEIEITDRGASEKAAKGLAKLHEQFAATHASLGRTKAMLAQWRAEAEAADRRAARLFGTVRTLRNAFLGVSAAAAAFTATGLFVAFKAVGEASRAGEALDDLSDALERGGPPASRLFDDLRDAAGSIERLTGVSRSSVVEIQTHFARLGVPSRRIQDLTDAVLDFAEATAQKPSQALRTFEQAIRGSRSGLASLGVQFDATASRAQRVSSIVGTVGSAFGGAALAGAASFEGRLDRIDSSGGALLRTFGQMIRDSAAVNGALQLVGDVSFEVVQYFEDIAGNRDEVEEFFRTATLGAVGAGQALGRLAINLVAIGETFAAIASLPIKLGSATLFGINERTGETIDAFARGLEAMREGLVASEAALGSLGDRAASVFDAQDFAARTAPSELAATFRVVAEEYKQATDLLSQQSFPSGITGQLEQTQRRTTLQLRALADELKDTGQTIPRDVAAIAASLGLLQRAGGGRGSPLDIGARPARNALQKYREELAKIAPLLDVGSAGVDAHAARVRRATINYLGLGTASTVLHSKHKELAQQQEQLAKETERAGQAARRHTLTLLKQATAMRGSVRPADKLAQKIFEIDQLARRFPGVITFQVREDLVDKAALDIVRLGNKGERSAELLADSFEAAGSRIKSTFAALEGESIKGRDVLRGFALDVLRLGVDESFFKPTARRLRKVLRDSRDEGEASTLRVTTEDLIQSGRISEPFLVSARNVETAQLASVGRVESAWINAAVRVGARGGDIPLPGRRPSGRDVVDQFDRASFLSSFSTEEREKLFRGALSPQAAQGASQAVIALGRDSRRSGGTQLETSKAVAGGWQRTMETVQRGARELTEGLRRSVGVLSGIFLGGSSDSFGEALAKGALGGLISGVASAGIGSLGGLFGGGVRASGTAIIDRSGDLFRIPNEPVNLAEIGSGSISLPSSLTVQFSDQSIAALSSRVSKEAVLPAPTSAEDILRRVRSLPSLNAPQLYQSPPDLVRRFADPFASRPITIAEASQTALSTKFARQLAETRRFVNTTPPPQRAPRGEAPRGDGTPVIIQNNITVQSIDPRTAADVILANSDAIEASMAGALNRHGPLATAIENQQRRS